MILSMCEIKGGEPLTQYEITMDLKNIPNKRKRDCVEIETFYDNGDSLLVQIPTEDFEEFVRQCQRMLTTLS